MSLLKISVVLAPKGGDEGPTTDFQVRSLGNQRRIHLSAIIAILAILLTIQLIFQAAPATAGAPLQETATPDLPGGPSVIETPTPAILPPADTATPTPVIPTSTPTPLPIATETPTPLPPATPLSAPTDTPTAVVLTGEGEATPVPVLIVETPGDGSAATELDQSTLLLLPPVDRPIEPPVEMVQPTLLLFLDQILAASIEASAWIWLTCGSLLFFIVAGIVAGINFYQQERRRYDLFDVEFPPRADRPAQEAAGDDSWPSSLP